MISPVNFCSLQPKYWVAADDDYTASFEKDLSLLRGYRAQIGYDGVEVVRRDGRIIVVAHGRLQLAAIAAHTLSDGALDLLVGPAADTLFLA